MKCPYMDGTPETSCGRHGKMCVLLENKEEDRDK